MSAMQAAHTPGAESISDPVLVLQAEAERVVFRDAHASDGFVLLPDMKWVRTGRKYLDHVVHI